MRVISVSVLALAAVAVAVLALATLSASAAKLVHQPLDSATLLTGKNLRALLAADGAAPGSNNASSSLRAKNLCHNAPSCGTVMTSFRGVPAHSNGKDQCTGNSCGGTGSFGLDWQCVELVQRFFSVVHGVKEHMWGANAIGLCDTHPAQVHLVSAAAVKPGDAIVLGWEPYGHTAIVTGVNGDRVDVMEQNNMPNGVNSYSKGEAKCFLGAR